MTLLSAAPTSRPPQAAARSLLSLLALSFALAGPARAQVPTAVRLPALGDSGSEDLSLGDEKRLGEQIMREARRDPDLLDDPVLLEYVLSLWRPLVAAARARGDIDAEIGRAHV